MYRLLLHKRAIKDYQRQDARVKARLTTAFEHLSTNPTAGRHIKRLTGELAHLYRYRVGTLRIIYEVHEDLKIVRVKAITSRGAAYKRR